MPGARVAAHPAAAMDVDQHRRLFSRCASRGPVHDHLDRFAFEPVIGEALGLGAVIAKGPGHSRRA